jgi:hypothetical protein
MFAATGQAAEKKSEVDALTELQVSFIDSETGRLTEVTDAASVPPVSAGYLLVRVKHIRPAMKKRTLTVTFKEDQYQQTHKMVVPANTPLDDLKSTYYAVVTPLISWCGGLEVSAVLSTGQKLRATFKVPCTGD